MRLLLFLVLIGIVALEAAIPTSGEDNDDPTILMDVVDVGEMHADDGDRQARHWGGGYGGGWGGGWGGPRWGGPRWGGPRWGGHGWGGRGWGGGWGWGGFYWG